MFAKIYDYDRNWDAPDGSDDELGDYIIREIVCIKTGGYLQLANGLLSQCFSLLDE